MTEEIREILEDNDELIVRYKDNSFESFDTLPKNVLDYITNLQEKLEVSQTNEETYRLEIEDITKCLGLDEDKIFDEVKEYATNLQKENEKLKHELKSKPDNEITLETKDGQIMTIIQSERIDMQEKLNKSLEEMYKKYQDLEKEINKQTEVIQWYEKENRHNQEIIIKDIKEIERLDNVIDELEKWLISYRTNIDNPDFYEDGVIDCLDETLNKLKSLKEGK